jgi:hypothetical protein
MLQNELHAQEKRSADLRLQSEKINDLKDFFRPPDHK